MTEQEKDNLRIEIITLIQDGATAIAKDLTLLESFVSESIVDLQKRMVADVITLRDRIQFVQCAAFAALGGVAGLLAVNIINHFCK